MQWISVRDRLPKLDEEVLTYCPDAKYHSQFMAAWFDGEDFWYDEQGSPAVGVTHWMIMPASPKDD